MYNRRSQRKVLGMLCTAGVMAFAAPAQAQWSAIGSSTGISTAGSSYVSLVKDSIGNYYVAYQDSSASSGSVMKHDGTSWSYMGGGGAVSGTNTLYNGLAVNNNGDLYYGYQDISGGNKLTVKQITASSVPNTWSAISNGQVYSNSMKIGPSGYPYQLSRDLSITGSGLFARRYDGTNWQQLGTSGFGPAMLPYYAQMAIGKNDSVYVAWVSALSAVQVYKIHSLATSTTTWQTVGTSGFATSTSNSIFQQYASVAVDTANRVYVAYVSVSTEGNKLKVRMYENGVWSTVGTDNFSAGSAAYLSLAVTPSGTPYIAFSDGANGAKTTVMKFDGTNWVIVGVAGISAGAAKYNSLTLDASGNPVVAFSDAGNSNKVVVMKYTPLCTNSDPGATPGSTGCVTFKYKGVDVTYTTVRGADNNIWLQQSLGSNRVATSITDTGGYGDVFQWGRWDDGHQVRNAPTAAAPAPNNPSGLGTGTSTFITGTPSWWAGAPLTDNWAVDSVLAVTSVNGCDPCKAMGAGWHMPTQTEWANVVTVESMTNQAQAYGSNLKLPMAGYRNTSGNLDFVNTRGYYWSSTTSSTGAKYLYCGTTIINPNAGGLRGQGASIRCLKASVIVVDSVRVGTLNGVSDTIKNNGDTLQLVAAVYPAWVNQNVTWSLKAVTGSAAITSNGVIRPTGNGTIWAIARSVLDATKSDSILVHIEGQIIPVTDVMVFVQDGKPAVIDTFQGTLQMRAIVQPITANQKVIWSVVAGTGSATIDTVGLVTAHADGTVWAKAVSVQDASMMDSMQIIISKQTPPSTSISSVERTLVNIYPNPTENGFYLQVNTDADGELNIIDQFGRKVAAAHFAAAQLKSKVYVDISSLASGNYHVILKAGQKVFTANISKK